MAKAINIPEEIFNHYKSLYLREDKPSAQSCWLATMEYVNKRDINIETFPSVKTFMRRLRERVSGDVIYLGRGGKAEWERKYGKWNVERSEHVRCS